MTEQPTPYDATEGLERAKTKLERALAETYVGHPTFMAFSDLVDLAIAESNLRLTEALIPNNDGINDELRMQVALINERIQRRSSEVPTYFKQHKPFRQLFENLMQATAWQKPPELLVEIRDSIAER